MVHVHVNFMFNLQHFAIHNVSSAILYGAIGIDLLVVRQNSYGFERSGPLIALYKYGDTYVPKPRGNSLPAIRYEPHMKTSQSIAANCLRRIACFS